VVEADIQGFFDPMDHAWLLQMRRWRRDDRAFLGLLRKWLKAGILETDGRVIHPDTGVPQGGVGSPVLANVSWHEALDRWVANVVKPHCRGEALLRRYADDLVCAFQVRSDAEWLYQVLPKRWGKFKREVSPEKTRILRFRRFHPGMRRRFACLGFEFFWKADRQRACRVSNAAPLARNCSVRANGSRSGCRQIGMCPGKLSSTVSMLGCEVTPATLESMATPPPSLASLTGP
jgi:RNA-directed DNA polymerase